MSTSLKRLLIGIVGYQPGIVLLDSTLTTNAISAAGFINSIQGSTDVTVGKDLIIASCSDGLNLFFPVFGNNGIITLEPVASGGTLNASQVYVSSLIGNDTTGTGTLSNPYASISHALTEIGTPTVNTTIVIIDDETYTENVHITEPLINIAGPNATLTADSGNVLEVTATSGSAVNCDIRVGSIKGTSSANAIVVTTDNSVVTYVYADRISSSGGNMSSSDGGLYIICPSISCDKAVLGEGSIHYLSAANAGAETPGDGDIIGLSPTGTNANFVFQANANVHGTLTISNNYDMPTDTGSNGQTFVNNGDGTVSWGAGGGGGGITWSAVAGTTQAAVINHGYVIQNASATTVTLPATAALGSIVYIQGLGAAGWVLTANTGQTIQVGNAATSSGGTVTSADQWDAIAVVCVVADTTWAMLPPVSSAFAIA